MTHDIFGSDATPHDPETDLENKSLADPNEAREHNTRVSNGESDEQSLPEDPIVTGPLEHSESQHGQSEVEGEVAGAIDLGKPSASEGLRSSEKRKFDVTDKPSSVGSVTLYEFFTPPWIENKALSLLDAIQKHSPTDKSGDRRRVLLAGYGFGGIIVKRVTSLTYLS